MPVIDNIINLIINFDMLLSSTYVLSIHDDFTDINAFLVH